MSTVSTSLPLGASIADVINADYNLAVGISVSSLLVNYLCLHPSTPFIPLIVPYHFSFNKMIDSKASLLFCSGNNLVKLF